MKRRMLLKLLAALGYGEPDYGAEGQTGLDQW